MTGSPADIYLLDSENVFALQQSMTWQYWPTPCHQIVLDSIRWRASLHSAFMHTRTQRSMHYFPNYGVNIPWRLSQTVFPPQQAAALNHRPTCKCAVNRTVKGYRCEDCDHTQEKGTFQATASTRTVRCRPLCTTACCTFHF